MIPSATVESQAPIHPKREVVWLLPRQWAGDAGSTREVTIRAKCIISLPNTKREFFSCHTATGGQLPKAPGSTLLMFRFAEWVKEKAICGVVKDNSEAPHQETVPETENSGLSNTSEPVGASRRDGRAVWGLGTLALHSDCVGEGYPTHAPADSHRISLTWAKQGFVPAQPAGKYCSGKSDPWHSPASWTALPKRRWMELMPQCPCTVLLIQPSTEPELQTHAKFHFIGLHSE